MIDAILGILYVLSFCLALFVTYVVLNVRGKMPLSDAWEHGFWVMAALFWPLTFMVTVAVFAYKGIIHLAEKTSEKVEKTAREYKEAWDDTRP